jgi:hypothetical protein
MKYVTPGDSRYYIRLPYHKSHRADAFTRISCNDGWEDVIYLAEAILDASGGVRKPEYVYVLVNKSVPGMVKIGMTTSTPDERARQISAATGVPTPWMPVYSFKCFRSDLLESELHDYFDAYRVNTHREMFRIDSVTAQNVIEELGQRYSISLRADSIIKNAFKIENND